MGFIALLAHAGGTEVAAQLLSCGAVESVIHAMASFRTNYDILEHGCFALENLVKLNSSLADEVLCAGGIGILSQQLGEHRSKARLVDQACLALSALLEHADS